MALTANTYVDEFRGTDKLMIAEITEDGANYTTGTPVQLAPVAEIAKTTETSSETKYYDNAPAFTINAEGADTITLTVPAISLQMLAEINGKGYDATTGAFMDGEGKPKYFALGYRLGLTDGTYRYVWRYKGSIAVPNTTATTKNAGTDSQGQELVYTGISTQHVFTKTGTPQKALVVDERDGKADVSNFFATVVTCDTIAAKA